MNRFRPSVLALSISYLANKFLKTDNWDADMTYLINTTEQDIKNCALDVFLLIHKVRKSQLSAVFRKFNHKRYHFVSAIKIKL